MNHHFKLKGLSALIFFLFFISSAWPSDFDVEVDEFFSAWDKADSPGCAVAVVKDGQIVYKNGYGMANLELGVPITPMSVFYIGSVSKQFVAMCVVLLADEGKLSLDDDIRKYVPEMPDYGTPITIRHLIHHTGGIRDYLELENIAGIPFGTYHEQDALDLIIHQRELNFKPGEENSYSNSGYFLLGVIIKRASGKSLREFAQENIFNPLGMKNSRFHDDYMELMKNRATGYYDVGKGNYRNFVSTFDCVGSGGLFTSVEDLFFWDQNFYHHKVGGEDVIELMHTQGVLNNGKKLDYAFGLVIGEYRGLRIVEHGGSLGGYRAELLRFPDQRFSVIILSNLSSFVPSELTRRVADIYLVDEFKEDKPEPERRTVKKTETFDVPEERLKEYAGKFQSEEIQAGVEIVVKEGKLDMRRQGGQDMPLQAIAEDRFRARGLIIQFIRNEKNEVTGIRLSSSRVRNLLFRKQEGGQPLILDMSNSYLARYRTWPPTMV
ncbi:MAG: beta-lactamase family protein [Candidatus Aminicenantes bacterium]|nr:beta-lactamase family protein [Candidatus Aminicenantes bacterium]